VLEEKLFTLMTGVNRYRCFTSGYEFLYPNRYFHFKMTCIFHVSLISLVNLSETTLKPPRVVIFEDKNLFLTSLVISLFF
jgi:hypothetical protein